MPAPSPATNSDLPTATRVSGEADLGFPVRQESPVAPFAATPPDPRPADRTQPMSRRNAPAARPTPLPKRPKGRLLVSAFLLAVFGTGAWMIWDNFFRYHAFGTVAGRLIHVSPHWNGVVETLHVREGDRVRQGQVLVTLHRLELEQQLERLGDQLKVAQATLSATVTQLKLESQLRGDRRQEAQAEYFELWGELLQRRSELKERETRRERLETLLERGHGTDAEVDSVKFAEEGLRSRIEKLEVAVEQMRQRVEREQLVEVDDTVKLKPQLVRIETLQAELGRVREQHERGTVRSPVNGTVMKTLRFTGEYADVSQPVLEVLQDGTMEMVVYVPQQMTTSVTTDDRLRVYIEPLEKTVECQVVRLGDRFEMPPQSLERRYLSHEKLLPVFVQPVDTTVAQLGLRLGSEVRLPFRWREARRSFTIEHRTSDIPDGNHRHR